MKKAKQNKVKTLGNENLFLPFFEVGCSSASIAHVPPVDDKIVVVPSDGLSGCSPNENELLLQFNDPGYHAVGVRGQTLFVVAAAKLPFVPLFDAMAAAFCMENPGGVSCAAKSCDTPPLW